MSEEGLRLTAKVKVRIKKYDEGVDPETGSPFEIIEHEVSLTSEQVKALGGKADAIDG